MKKWGHVTDGFIALKIQKSLGLLPLLTLFVLGFDIFPVVLLLTNNFFGLAIIILLFRFIIIWYFRFIFFNLHLITISFLDLFLSTHEFLDIHAFFSIVPSSFITIILMKYLIVLLLFHLLNINIPILLTFIILPIFDSSSRPLPESDLP